MTMAEHAGKVGTAAVSAMASQPLSIALLLVNVCFLALAGYVLGEVAENTRVMDRTQMDLVVKLVSDIRDCRQGKAAVSPLLRLPPFARAISD